MSGAYSQPQRPAAPPPAYPDPYADPYAAGPDSRSRAQREQDFQVPPAPLVRRRSHCRRMLCVALPLHVGLK